MTRPILWATGTLVAVALSASLAGQRISSVVKPAASGTPAAQARGDQPPRDRILVLHGDARGHFLVHPQVDGLVVKMMVDTGASLVALRSEDAAAIGIRPQPREFNRPTSTANGTVMVAPVRIREMRVGDITVHDVEAVVVPAGRLGTNLLGMSFLRRLKGFEMASGRLTLKG